MKKRIIRAARLIACFVAAATVFTAAVYASSTDATITDNEIKRSVPSSAEKLLQNVDTADPPGIDAGLGSIAKNGLEQLPNIFRDLLAVLSKILAVAVVCSVVASLNEVAKSPVLSKACTAAGAAAIFILSANNTDILMGLGRQTINDMDTFSKIYLPVYTAAAAAAGNPAAAIAKQGAAILFSNVLITVIDNIFLPLTMLYAVMRTIGTAVDNKGLSKMAGFIKTIVTVSLKISLTLFFAYISISGAIGSASDSLLKRSVRLTVSSTVPVIGGVVTEAADAIFAGAAMIRNTVGTAGLFILIATAFIPCLKIGLHYLGYKLVAALISFMQPEGLGDVVDSFSEVMGMIFGMAFAITVLLAISIIAGFISLGG